MSTQPYTGPGFFLSGGQAINDRGDLRFTAANRCTGGVCSGTKPAAPAARAQAPEPGPDLDPAKIYAARREAAEEARANPAKPKPPRDEDVFTAAASEAVYRARQ